MNIFQQLTEKPWLTPQGVILEPAIARRTEVPKAKMGLWVFLSVVTVLFFLLIFAYAGRMAFEDWRPGPELGLLWFNTLALLCGSIAMQWATVAARRERLDEAWLGLVAGGLMAFIFLAGQVLAWRQLRSMGGFGVEIPAVAFFYLITGLHALHIAGGLVAWGEDHRPGIALRRDGKDPTEHRAVHHLLALHARSLAGPFWPAFFGQ